MKDIGTEIIYTMEKIGHATTIREITNRHNEIFKTQINLDNTLDWLVYFNLNGITDCYRMREFWIK